MLETCSKCGELMQKVFSNYFCDCDVLPEVDGEDPLLDPEVIRWVSERDGD